VQANRQKEKVNAVVEFYLCLYYSWDQND